MVVCSWAQCLSGRDLLTTLCPGICRWNMHTFYVTDASFWGEARGSCVQPLKTIPVFLVCTLKY